MTSAIYPWLRSWWICWSKIGELSVLKRSVGSSRGLWCRTLKLNRRSSKMWELSCTLNTRVSHYSPLRPSLLQLQVMMGCLEADSSTGKGYRMFLCGWKMAAWKSCAHSGPAQTGGRKLSAGVTEGEEGLRFKQIKKTRGEVSGWVEPAQHLHIDFTSLWFYTPFIFYWACLQTTVRSCVCVCVCVCSHM